MRACHRLFLVSLLLIFFISPWIAVISLALAVPTLAFLYQAGARAFGSNYAIRQAILAVGLSLIFGLGLILVPWLVDSDIAKALSRSTAT